MSKTAERSTKRHISLLLFLMTCLFAMFAYVLTEGYRRAVEAAEVNTRNLVQVVESRVHGDLARAVGLLDFLQNELRAEVLKPANSARHREAIEHQLAHLLTSFQEARVVNVFDAEGELLYSSNPATPRFNIRDRPFYASLRNDPQSDLIFTDPQISRSTGRLAQVIIKAIRNAEGRYLGAASVVMNLDGYTSLFSNIDLGPDGVMQLRRADNFKLVLREPSLPDQSPEQTLAPHHPIRQRIEAGDTKGTSHLLYNSDGVKRIASFRKVNGFPFYAQVGVADATYLANWRRQSVLLSGIGLLLMGVLAAGIVRLLRGEQREQTALNHVVESEMRFRKLAESSPSGIWQTNADGDCVYVSRRWCEIAGLSPERALGKGWAETLHPDDHERIFREWTEAAQGEDQLFRSEFRFRHEDGTTVWVLCLAIHEVDQAGKRTGWIGTITDITAQMQIESELQHSNSELEQFSYSISHDMRQPLRMISSYLQLLAAGLAQQLDDEQREHLNFAVDGAQRLDGMLVGLLEYSRAGRKGEPPTWVDSRSLLGDALRIVQPAAAEASADIRIEGNWPRVFVRPDELLRLLQNLLANAIKFRVAGRPPVIGVSSRVANDRWHLCISDNGIGIQPDQIGRLFQVFQRLQARANYDGTGIGLALCRKIVEHHGGVIRAESAGEGQGCRFLIELPLKVEVTA